MAVFSDFTVIQFDSKEPNEGSYKNPYTIGDNLPGSFKITFNTGGEHHSPALLSLMVRRLTIGSARVAIKSPTTQNVEKTIGRLDPTPTSLRNLWRHEQFVIPTNLLNSGSAGEPNTLVIGRVPGDGQPNEEFEVRDIVCFFHQET